MTFVTRNITAQSPVPDRFLPPADAIRLYSGKVMHARLKPFGHRFTYTVFSILIDVDRLADANCASRIFSVNGPNLVSFQESDHIAPGDQARTLGEYIRGLLAGAGLSTHPQRIFLLTFPRLFGYVFNPISVYFVYGADNGLVALIYEVRNTFGSRHSYVCRIEPGELTAAGVRQTRMKNLHVSPFIGMDATYRFRLQPPGDEVKLRILETEKGEPLLSAAFNGIGEAFSTRSVLKRLAAMPLMTMKVTAGIHWEALKLWLKGAVFHRSPPDPSPTSYHDASSPVEKRRN